MRGPSDTFLVQLLYGSVDIVQEKKLLATIKRTFGGPKH